MRLKTYDILGNPEDIRPVIKILKKYRQLESYPDNPNFYIVVGGDGSVLNQEIKEKIYNKPVLRVHHRKSNTKSLGFSADVTLNNLAVALKEIANEICSFRTEQLLGCNINDKIKDTVINDVTIKPRNPSSSLFFNASIYTLGYNEPLPSPGCTALVISGKYGSTAYNYSTGGSINLDVPCMHINFESSTIKQEHYICKLEDSLLIELFCDSLITVDRAKYTADYGSKIIVQKSNKFIHFIRTPKTRESLKDKIDRQIEHSRSRERRLSR